MLTVLVLGFVEIAKRRKRVLALGRLREAKLALTMLLSLPPTLKVIMMAMQKRVVKVQ